MQDVLEVQEKLAYLVYSLRFATTVLDLLLVTITFFLILTVIRRSQAAVLLRGILLLALVLVVVTALLPLPTFDWLLRGALLISLIATPIIFQPELRRGLERLGRTFGFLNLRPTELAHQVVPPLVRSASHFSSKRIGALIVLEGETSLADVISTGTTLHARLSSELLESIFPESTPLHDGAVIIREDEIQAAACVLPLSEQALPDGMHQGTRHRAALGISERSDCLAIVVSEETGIVSVAQNGKLQRDLDATQLRDRLFRFYDPRQSATGALKGRRNAKRGIFSKLSNQTRLGLAEEAPQARRLRPSRTHLLHLANYLLMFVLAAVLGVAAWLLVIDQVSPPQKERIEGIDLRLINQNKDTVIVTNVPEKVAVTAQAPQDILVNMQPESFRATLDLNRLDTDVHRVPIDIKASDSKVRIVDVDPPAVDVELRPLASRPITVAVVVSDRESLPFSYEISGEPTASPAQVTVQGPADLVTQIAQAEVPVALQGTRASIEEERPVVLKDSAGKIISGVAATPEKVKVSVPIRQRFNTRDAAVHVVITGTVAPGYWISNISVEPKTVTLLGTPSVLEEIGGFVDTVPVDVTSAAGDIDRRVTLAPPPSVSALNERGVVEGSVQVRVTVVPQLGNLRLTVPVEVVGAQPGDTVGKSPAAVDVLLSGPLPILNDINADPKLVRVVVDVSALAPGTQDVTPTLIAPESLKATMLPGTIQVRLDRPTTPTTIPDDALGATPAPRSPS